MKSTDQLIINQTERSFLIKVIAALLFTATAFLIFLVYWITFQGGFAFGKERDFKEWGKQLKSVMVLGVFSFGIGSYLAKRKRIIFDQTSKKYKLEYYIGPFYWGSWTNYEALKMIGIFKNSKDIYELNIWFSNSRHLKFEKFRSFENALAEANYIAEILSLKIWNASDSKNGFYIE